MKIAIVLDKFKNGATQQEITGAVQQHISKQFTNVTLKVFHLADGGENTLEALSDTLIDIHTQDALRRSTISQIGLSGNQIIVEMARAVGLQQLRENERDPFKTSTHGLGLVLKQLLEDNTLDTHKQLILSVGGSATNDLGLGFLQALGCQFFDIENKLIEQPITPEIFQIIQKIDYSKLNQVTEQIGKITVISDVMNMLTGENGASRVFAPQKGASKQQVDYMEQQIIRLSNILNFDELPGDGAAGGIVYVLRNICKANILQGAQFILQKQNFLERCVDCDLLITGEGMLDKSTTFGKACFVACNLFAQVNHGPRIGVFGQIQLSKEQYSGFLDAAFCIQREVAQLKEALTHTIDNVVNTISNVISLFKAIQGNK